MKILTFPARGSLGVALLSRGKEKCTLFPLPPALTATPSPFDELEDDVRQPLLLADVIHVDDVLVMEPCGRLGFIAERRPHAQRRTLRNDRRLLVESPGRTLSVGLWRDSGRSSLNVAH